MENWYYFNEIGERVGPVTASALKQLVRQGMITRETVIESTNGRSAIAGKVNGLIFPEAIQAEPIPPVEPNPFTASMPISGNPFTAALPMKASPGDHSSADPLHKTSIIIERKAGVWDFGVNYVVFLDGIMIGESIKGTTEFPVSPGRHVLELIRRIPFRKDQEQAFQQARENKFNRFFGITGLMGSRKVVFTIAEGEHICFFAKNALTFWKVMLYSLISCGNPALYYMWKNPTGWLILERQ